MLKIISRYININYKYTENKLKRNKLGDNSCAAYRVHQLGV